MKYDELISELRHYFEDVPLVLQAADAIEELRNTVLRLEDESGLYDELPIYYIDLSGSEDVR